MPRLSPTRRRTASPFPAFLIFAVLALAFAAPATLHAAEIAGVVALPKPRTPAVVNRRYEIVSQGGVLSTDPPLAIVYLEGTFPPAETPPVAQIIQKDLRFSPTVLAVRTGTKVEFPNLDDAYHNIFSYSAPKRFDLGRYRSDERPIPSQVFDSPGLITLRCDVHEHMRALVLVIDSPHFVTTDPDGRFRLPQLPAGKFTLKVWLDSRTTLSRSVELAADTVLQADFP